MMKSNCLLKIISSFSLLVLFSANVSAKAEPLRVSIPQMPVHAESHDKGVLVDFVKVLSKKLKRDIDIQVVPFSRSIYYVSTNKVDFHLPFIKPNIESLTSQGALVDKEVATDLKLKQHSHDFIYSDETIFHVNFVLYSHIDVPIDMNKIKDYKIETDSAHLPFLEDVSLGSDCITCSLKNVQHKMTDGYIFADSSTDPLLRKNESLLPSIKREFYQKFAVKILFPNTEKGRKLNKKISTVIADMRLSGELTQLLSSVDFPYDDWQLPQPY
ncbi:hypothetical protein EKO29_14920 [Colwellia sp. Arc7-635]|nr:hypothetical protein EKO29_14920 [Colwellia sp. Arc7-635]